MAEIADDIEISCNDENRRGGIRRIFITNKGNVSTFTASTDHSYSAVTMTATNDYFYEIEAEFETKGLVSEGSIENGSNMMTRTLEVKIPKLEKTKGATVQDLFESCKVIIVFSDYNGKAFAIGYDEFLKKDAAMRCKVSENLGAGVQDENGYTLSFEGKAAEIAREYTGTITLTTGSITPASA